MSVNSIADADLCAIHPTPEQIIETVKSKNYAQELFDLIDVLMNVRLEVDAIEYLRYHAVNNLPFAVGDMNDVNAINAAMEACIEKAKDYIAQMDDRMHEIWITFRDLEKGV